MPKYTLDFNDETLDILIGISSQLELPPEADIETRLAFVIDAIANSIDSSHEVATSDEGSPLQMQEALEAILNPHIGSSYTKPTTALHEEKRLTWEQVKKILPDIEAEEQYDNLTRKAICIVFNELPQDEWSSEHAEILIDKTIALLRHQEAAGEEH